MSFDKMSTDEIIKKPFMKPDLVPQPHFIPGYTGFCPELPLNVGASYGRITHEVLKDKPRMAGRLDPIDAEVAHPTKKQEKVEKKMEEDKKIINNRFPSIGRRILNDYMMPGYCGHVPNITDAVGTSFSKGCVTSIAKFIREQADEKQERPKYNY
ncbi:protein FAM166B-like [Stegodyphus dumicola]|uniref:protein FAM166B-like n=1 Tax=Stegodyphus dumicola TaxID=202533 RepID=UPI0015AA5B74|nr:protein FAM166B-like [Stegodyphus dumicola]